VGASWFEPERRASGERAWRKTHCRFADRQVAIKVAYPESRQDQQEGARYHKLFFNEAKIRGENISNQTDNPA
jgi:hypothetical protein